MEGREREVSVDNAQQDKRQEERTILINFVLDKSGSMGSIREATIAGFNKFLEEQQEEGGSAVFTLTLFDTHFRTVARTVPIAQMRPLDQGSYVPGGNTALYDAIAHTMSITDQYVATQAPDQVVFVIMTDGQENSSREFGRQQIMEMIEDRQKTAGYEFIYLGANQDAYVVGAGIGIHGGRSLDYAATPAEALRTMGLVSANIKSHRRMGQRSRADGEFFSASFEALGSMSYDEYVAQRDRDLAQRDQAHDREQQADRPQTDGPQPETGDERRGGR
jgi:hypothetical protein